MCSCPVRPRSTLLFASLLTLSMVSVAGCDFFKELESLPGAEDGTGTDGAEDGDGDGGDETDGGPCTVLDERCPDQDTLEHCNPESGEIETISCPVTCGSELLNFTCTPTDSFAHGCWCVPTGNIKLINCTQLEQCIADCGDPSSTCSANCFSDTTPQTTRLLGALFSCADRTCDPLCAESPEQCGVCLLAARAGLYGECGLERAVCDSDETDEPSWP